MHIILALIYVVSIFSCYYILKSFLWNDINYNPLVKVRINFISLIPYVNSVITIYFVINYLIMLITKENSDDDIAK